MKTRLLRRLRRKAQRNVRIEYNKDYTPYLVIGVVYERFLFIAIDKNIYLTSEGKLESELRNMRIRYIQNNAEKIRMRRLYNKLRKL